jgi:alpha-D-xyloside xylohydrolase
MPYLYRFSIEAGREGLPLMRPMVLEFPDDPACACLDRQFMLGNSLLVAPVFSEKGYVSYYLPKGKWTNILSGEQIEGGSWQTEKHNYSSLPLLARPNSILALGSNRTRPDYDYSDAVVFHVFELDDGKTAIFETCDCLGKIEGNLEVSRQKNKISIAARDMKKPWSLCFRGIHSFGYVKGGEAKERKEGMLFTMSGNTGQAKVEL